MATGYCAASRRDLDRLDVHVAFGHWKLARIAADILRRMQRGAMGKLELDPTMLREQIVARRRLATIALDGEW